MAYLDFRLSLMGQNPHHELDARNIDNRDAVGHEDLPHSDRERIVGWIHELHAYAFELPENLAVLRLQEAIPMGARP